MGIERGPGSPATWPAAPPLGEKKRRIEVEEWEEPLHPDPRGGNLTHALPQRNPICTFSPTSGHLAYCRSQKVGAEQVFRGVEVGPPPVRDSADPVASCADGREVAAPAVFRPRRVPPRWDAVGQRWPGLAWPP